MARRTGAVDPDERRQALDLLGFEQQVVFSSLCAPLFAIPDPALRHAAYRAHNRSMAAFCSVDPRLLGVALCDLDDVAGTTDVSRSMSTLDEAIALGLRLVWIPARAPGGRAPGHVAHDRFWERIADARVPFVLHVGSSELGIGAEWLDNGRPAAEEMTGAEIIGSKDFMVVFQPAERFHVGARARRSARALPDAQRRCDRDGCRVGAVHAASPRPRGGDLAALRTPPRDVHPRTVAPGRRPLRFTPYPFEDVGRLCAESDPALYVFSSDYPHAEGGRDPIGRFDRSLAAAGAMVGDGFFAEHAADWLGQR